MFHGIGREVVRGARTSPSDVRIEKRRRAPKKVAGCSAATGHEAGSAAPYLIGSPSRGRGRQTRPPDVGSRCASNRCVPLASAKAPRATAAAVFSSAATPPPKPAFATHTCVSSSSRVRKKSHAVSSGYPTLIWLPDPGCGYPGWLPATLATRPRVVDQWGGRSARGWGNERPEER